MLKKKKKQRFRSVISFSFFAGFSSGVCSVLYDLDHSLFILGLREPFNLSGQLGRPWHDPIFCIAFALLYLLLIVALTNGWIRSMVKILVVDLEESLEIEEKLTKPM